MSTRANEIGTIAATFAASLLVGGFVICALAYPSPALIMAVCFEVAFLAVLIYWRHFRRKPRENEKRTDALNWLRLEYPRLFRLRDAVQIGGTLGAVVVALIFFIEFTGFTVAYLQMYQTSEAIYVSLPVSKWLTGHPAQSLEYLAGAYVEAGNYPLAHPLYESIARIRKQSLPPDDELVSAIWTDIGVLYMRQKDYLRAEDAFRRSQTMATVVASNPKTGRLLTGLANSLREQRRFDEAEKVYLQAIDMRSKLYGKNSIRVAETLNEYAVLLERTNRSPAAQKRRGQVIDILASQQEPYSLPTAVIAIVTAITAIVSFFIFGGESFAIRIASFLLKRKSAKSSLSAGEERLLSVLCASKQKPG